jgi:hypothetical protein
MQHKLVPLHLLRVRGSKATGTHRILNSRDVTSDDALVRHVASPLDIPLQQGKTMESTNCADRLFKSRFILYRRFISELLTLT